MTKDLAPILEAFTAMWGLYPAPVFLIQADREILGVNDCAKEMGINPGIKCHSLYPCETHCPGCLAQKALNTGEAVRKCSKDKRTGNFLDGYWIPVKGNEDIYVHFGNDITEYVKPELIAD